MDKEHVFFENYAQHWDRDRKENPQLLACLMSFAAIKRGSAVLDVGSGTGILLPYLADAVGPKGTIEELDYSHQMLTKAQTKFSRIPGVTYTEKNILKYKIPGEVYDAIICLNFYPHIAAYKEAFIKKMAGALRVGGALIIMHDMPRSRVNALCNEFQDVLPPLDAMATLLVSAGLSVTMAMDTADGYFIKAEKPVGDVGPAGPGHEQPHGHSHTQTKVVMNRLARISGHLEAIKRMIEENRDCSDVLIQLLAVRSALMSVSKVILDDHIDHCIVDALQHGDTAAINKLKKAIDKFYK